MNAYELEGGGGLWWVVAPTVADAIATCIALVAPSCEYLTIERLEKAYAARIDIEGRSLAQIAAEATEAALVHERDGVRGLELAQ